MDSAPIVNPPNPGDAKCLNIQQDIKINEITSDKIKSPHVHLRQNQNHRPLDQNNCDNNDKIAFNKKGNVFGNISQSSSQPQQEKTQRNHQRTQDPPPEQMQSVPQSPLKREDIGDSEKMQIQQSESSLEDQGQIIKAQLQYHYQEGDNSPSNQSSSEEFTSSPDANPSNTSPKIETPIYAIKQQGQGTQAKEVILLIKTQAKTPKKKKINKPSKPKKVKKNYKCKICKGSGKKAQTKKCRKCKQYVHLICLEVDESNIPQKYVCQKCKFQQSNRASPEQAEVINLQPEEKQANDEYILDQYLKQQQEKNGYMSRTDRIFLEKLSCNRRKLNRFDKKNIQFQEFRLKYPFYVEGDKVRFPIDDRLLIIYAQLLQVEDRKRYPPSDHPTILSQHLGNFLQIQNWLISFHSLVKTHFPECQLPSRFNKQYLYESMSREGYDQAFIAIFCCILRIFLADIFDGNRKQNMKMLSENSFFSILTLLKEGGDMKDQFLAMSGSEIISQLSNVPSFRIILRNITVPKVLDVVSKSSLIIELLKGLTETNGFKLLAVKKTEVIQELIEKKGKLIASIKLAQAGKLQNRQKIKQYQDIMEEQEGSVDSEDGGKQYKNKKKKKQKQKAKKKLNQINSQNTLTQTGLIQTKQKLNECIRSLQFATTEIIFLGKDRNGSQFFFSRYEPYRIYVHYRQYLSDLNKTYKMYQGKERILEIFHNLNCKGVNEKRLHHNLNTLIKLNMIRSNINLEIQEPEQFDIKVHQYQITRELIVDYFKQIQEQLYQFYKERTFQWTNDEHRIATWKLLQEGTDFQNFAQILNSVQQLFLNVDIKVQNPKKTLKKPYGITFENQLKMSNLNIKRKMAMRIWGSNPQRIKKPWSEYLLKEPNCTSIWICLYMLKIHVDKFIKRKLEVEEVQRRKYQKMEKLNAQRRNYQEPIGEQEEQSSVRQEKAVSMTRLRRATAKPTLLDDSENNEQISEVKDLNLEPAQSSQARNRRKSRKKLKLPETPGIETPGIKTTRRSLRQRKVQSQQQQSDQQIGAQSEQNNSLNTNSPQQKRKKKRQKVQEKQVIQALPVKKKSKHKHRKQKLHQQQEQIEQPFNQKEPLKESQQQRQGITDQKTYVSSKKKKNARKEKKAIQQHVESIEIQEKVKQQSNSKSKYRKRNSFKLVKQAQQSEEIMPTRRLRQRKLTQQSQSSLQQSQQENQRQKGENIDSPDIRNHQISNQQDQQPKEKSINSKENKSNSTVCIMCNTETQNIFVTCFECQQRYHLKCASLNRKPRTEWICSTCTNKNSIRLTRSKR